MDRPVPPDGQPDDEQNAVTPESDGDVSTAELSEPILDEAAPKKAKGGAAPSRGRVKILVGALVLMVLGFYLTDDGGGVKRKKKKNVPAVAQASTNAGKAADLQQGSTDRPGPVAAVAEPRPQTEAAERDTTPPSNGTDADDPQALGQTAMNAGLTHESATDPSLLAEHSPAIPASLLLAEVSLAVPMGLFLLEIEADQASGVQITGVVSAGRRLESLALLTDYIDALKHLPFLGEITERVSYVEENEDLDFTLQATWRALP